MSNTDFEKRIGKDLRTFYVFGPKGCLSDFPLKEVKPKLEAWIDYIPDHANGDTSKWIPILAVGYRFSGGKNYFDINEHGMVELPADNPSDKNGQYTFQGTIIYKYYNRNDEKGVADQWGKAEHIAGLINAIIEYWDTYPDDLLNIGDMRSPKDGRVPKNSHGGLHHANKGAFDIRPLGKGGSYLGEFSSSNHDVVRSKAFIKAMGNHVFTRVIVGRNIYEKLKDATTSKITVAQDPPGGTVHSNHYHFDINQ